MSFTGKAEKQVITGGMLSECPFDLEHVTPVQLRRTGLHTQTPEAVPIKHRDTGAVSPRRPRCRLVFHLTSPLRTNLNARYVYEKNLSVLFTLLTKKLHQLLFVAGRLRRTEECFKIGIAHVGEHCWRQFNASGAPPKHSTRTLPLAAPS